MWVSKREYWNSSATIKDKFFVQKIIQLCDYDEGISKRHRTTNGYILLKEILQLAQLSILRPKTIKGLALRITEAKDRTLKNSISNDIIINQYFEDLKSFIDEYDSSFLHTGKKIDREKLERLIYRLSIFNHQLDQHYFKGLQDELLASEINNNHFARQANRFSQLIELYMTYLLFKGYSASGIRNRLISMMIKGKHISVDKFLKIFNEYSKKAIVVLALSDINDEITDFAELLGDEYEVDILGKSDSGYYEYLNGVPCLKLEVKSLDVVNEIRKIYDKILKELVVRKDRESLKSFNNFFENAYWTYPGNDYLVDCKLKGDPIAVKERERSIIPTLKKLGYSKEKELSDGIPKFNNSQLFNSVYYYNLALGSKSIENSLSLLWTSLESSIPYRPKYADIENVQHIVSKVLGLGCFARDISNISRRFENLYKENSDDLLDAGLSVITTPSNQSEMGRMFEWLSKPNMKRFDKIKAISDLQAYQYNEIFTFISAGNSKSLLTRILSSRISIEHQLQRIYLHRNNIVHAGDFISEYTNLWSHTEYYAGKILALQIHIALQGKDIKEEFQKIESEYDYVVSYLRKNPQKKILELPDRILQAFFSNYWQ